MKKLLAFVLASAALCAASPLHANIPEWDPAGIVDALWDGQRPSPVVKPVTYVSGIYVREGQAKRDMKLKVIELRLSGSKVVKFGVRRILGRRYVFVIVYYPGCDPRLERPCFIGPA
jgi:hypothetical protein